MPNRILRDWTDSFTIDELDVHAERFFVRLIMKVDDYGRFSADARLLKSNLFQLKSNIRDTDISRWLTACEKAGLITVYSVANKSYLQIINFKQQLRQKTEKYPAPIINKKDANRMHSTCIADASLKRNEEETETEGKNKFSPPTLEDVKKYFNEKGYLESIAIKAFEYYNVADWSDAKGNKVKNWKQKMNSVWFKDEHKIPDKQSIKQKKYGGLWDS